MTEGTSGYSVRPSTLHISYDSKILSAFKFMCDYFSSEKGGQNFYAQYSGKGTDKKTDQ